MIETGYVKSEDQLLDLFTKSLGCSRVKGQKISKSDMSLDTVIRSISLDM